MQGRAPTQFSALRLTMPTESIRARVNQIPDAISEESDDILTAISIDLLSDIQDNYRTMARGQAGADGETWEWVQAGTLLARMRRVSHLTTLQKKTDKEAAAAFRASSKYKPGHGTALRIASVGSNRQQRANAAALESLEKAGVIDVVSVKGKAAKKAEKRFKPGNLVVLKKGEQTSTVKEQLKKQVSPQSGGYEIGVDTGMQINTLQPGKVGSEGPTVTRGESYIIVAAAMNYSKHFDDMRPIIPQPLPEKWMDGYQAIAVAAGSQVVQRLLEKPSQ